MFKKDAFKKIGISILTLLLLTLLLLFIFRDNMADFYQAFRSLSVPDIVCLVGMGAANQLLDALVCFRLIRNVLPTVRYGHALTVIYLGVFGNVSTFSAGTIPMQAYYLHRRGVEVGHGIGIMTLQYLLHKTSIVLFSTIMLIAGGKWLYAAYPDIHGFIIAGYIICAAVVGILVLLCTWDRAHRAAMWLIGKFPDRGKWKLRAEKIGRQLDHLFLETKAGLKRKDTLLFAFFVNIVKLGIFCAVPYVCMRILGRYMLGILQVELLTSLMLLISNAVPNVAGIGPKEIVFWLLYRPLLGDALASSSLLFFRITTYYLPFLISIFVFLAVQMRLVSKGKNEEEEQS